MNLHMLFWAAVIAGLTIFGLSIYGALHDDGCD